MSDQVQMFSDIEFSKIANLQDKQLAAIETLLTPECKYLLYGGAAGGGKSRFLRWGAVAYGIYINAKYGIKHLPIGLFSEDYPTLRDRQIIKIAEEMPSWLGEIKETQKEGLVFKAHDDFGGFVIMLRNLDDPSKYSSVEFAAIFVEELTKNKRATFDSLRSRMRYPGLDEVKFVGATNPGEVGHGWVKRLWIAPDPKDLDDEHDRFYFIQATVYDNKYVSTEYIRQLESLPEDRRRALLEGDWDMFAGQYFTEFRRDKHVIKFSEARELMGGETRAKIAGLDWGRSNPFCFLGAVILPMRYGDLSFDRVVIYYEAYGTEKNPTDWAKIVSSELKLSGYSFIEADPAIFTKGQDGSIAIADQFKNFSNDFKRLIRPAGNSRVSGWENLHGWLSIAPDGKPYLLITDNCTNLIRTLPELVHDKLKVEDVDSAGEDHAPDTARYMLSSEVMKWVGNKTGVVKTGLTKEKQYPSPHEAIDLAKFNQKKRKMNLITPR